MRINRNNDNRMQGHVQTRQRQLLLQIIREEKGHIDAKELYRRAAERDASISTATVYRSLNLFKHLGLIDEKRLGQGSCTYEIKKEQPHQHLVCRECGKIFDFECPLSEVVKRVRQEQGFVVTRAEVYLEGYCGECAAKQSSYTE